MALPSLAYPEEGYQAAPSLNELTLLPGQTCFFQEQSKYVAAVTGLGGGKTLTGCAKAIVRYHQTPGSLNLIVAPTYPMLRDTVQRTFFEILPPSWILKWNKNHNHLTLKNRAEVLFRPTFNYEMLRGPNIASVYVDEAALVPYEAWRVIKGRLRQRGFTPQAWLTSTPRGKNWLYQEFYKKATVKHVLVKWSGRENEKNLPPSFYDDLGYEGNFAAQEIEGDFVAFEGLVYTFEPDPLVLGTHVRSAPKGKRFPRVVGGIDWGFSNPAVALPFGIDGDHRAWQLDEFYQRRASLHETFIPKVIEFSRQYGVEVWYCGPDEPEHIEDLNTAFKNERLLCRAEAADNNVTAGIQTVSRLLAPRDDKTRGLYVDSSCANTVAEFGQYQYPTKEVSQRDPAEKPIKSNDHALDALRYCLHSTLGKEMRHGSPLSYMEQYQQMVAEQLKAQQTHQAQGIPHKYH